MKKIVGIIVVLVILLVVGIATLATIDINRLGKDNLYAQIGEFNKIEETKLDSGQIVRRYWYELPAFDENGEIIIVEFSAGKELRKDAYLMLYVKKGNEVTSYNEVQWEDIPVEAQVELKV